MSYKKQEQEDTHLSETDVRSRLNSLSKADLHRLIQAAHSLNGTVYTADELVQEAILRTLNGDRKWKKEMDTIPFLYSAMRSIAHAGFKKKSPENKKASVVNENGDDMEITDTLPLAEANLIQQEESADIKEKVEKIFAIFENDEEATLLLIGVMDGLSVSEIKDQMKLSETQYESIRKRIRRKTK